MALLRGNSKDVPEDAVRLTSDEALRYQYKIIDGWENFKDVWALKHTTSIIGSLAAMTGIYVNNHYRSRLRLGNYGRLSSYVPIVVIPAMFSVVMHKMFVQHPILLNPIGECPLCMQLRAASLQTGFGVLHPAILAPLASFMFATRHFTYNVPSPTQQPREMLQLWRKLTKPIFPVLGTMLMGHGLVAMYLTFKQAEQNFKLQQKLIKIEREVEEKNAMEQVFV